MRRSLCLPLWTLLLLACPRAGDVSVTDDQADTPSPSASAARPAPPTPEGSAPEGSTPEQVEDASTQGPDPTAAPAPLEPEPGPHRSRAEFAELLGGLRKGMPAAKARELLGEPDDVRTKFDMGGLTTARTREIWRYGTRGHLSFPTLGRVTIDARDRVQYVYGGSGSPPDASVIPEGELRAYLRIIDRVSSYNAGAGHDALALIRAVNALQPLGKARALQVIAEYLRVASPLHDPAYPGTMLLLRVLFDADTIPPMYVGAPAEGPPSDPSAAPLHPIVLSRDIPMLLVSGYMLGGFPEQPDPHLRYFQANGRMRQDLLRPGAHPEQLVTALADEVGAPRQLISSQLLRLMSSVYRPAPGPAHDDPAAYWPEHERALAELDARWDGAHQEYRLPDGSRLPPIEAPLYTRAIWSPEHTDTEVELILERQDPHRVHVHIHVANAQRRSEGAFILGERRFEVSIRPGQSFTQGSELLLEAGQSVQFTYESGDERQQSPPMTP